MPGTPNPVVLIIYNRYYITDIKSIIDYRSKLQRVN